MSNLVIVGDQAFTPEEWEVEQRKRRDKRRYENDPERRAKKAAAYRRWVEAHRDHLRAYKREWNRRQRIGQRQAAIEAGEALLVRPVASLHALACTGPTKATGCKCRKVVLYEKVDRAA